MAAVKFDLVKAKHAFLYLLKHLNDGRRDIHSVFKALYFAEKYHFGQFGRVIAGDRFVSMEYGPVPSVIYDWTGESWETKDPIEDSIIMKHRINMCATSEPNFEELSQSEIEALDKAIGVVNDADLEERTALSYYDTYNVTTLNTTVNYIKIAEATGASKEEINFMLERLEVPETFVNVPSALGDSYPEPIKKDFADKNLQVSASLS